MNTLRPLLILLFASVAYGDSIPLGNFSSSSGKNLKWEADSKQIEATPSWSGAGNCPFDIGKLSDLALAYAKTHAVDPNEIRMTGVSLHRFNAVGKHKELGDKWSVTVDFLGHFQGSPSSIHILTDGTIIEPSEDIRK